MSFRIVRGGPLALGVNYRLAYGWDFGRSPGPALGLEDPVRAALVERDFEHLAAHGIRFVRWFLLGDGRNGIRFSGETPVGLEPEVVPAVRAALDAAARHGIEILFVLLDHTFAFYPEAIPGTPLIKQGHSRVLTQDYLFEALLGNVFLPLFAAIDGHPAVFAYEMLNEPEMVLHRRDYWLGEPSGVGCPLVPETGRLTVQAMRERLSQTRQAVHDYTPAQFSVGAMCARWMAHWAGVLDPARDFLTFHYYGDEPDFPRLLDTRVAPLADRLPVGLGEFYAEPREHWPAISTTGFLEYAADAGLQLAAPWVWNPGERDPGQIRLSEMRAFASALSHNERHAWSTSLHAS